MKRIGSIISVIFASVIVVEFVLSWLKVQALDINLVCVSLVVGGVVAFMTWCFTQYAKYQARVTYSIYAQGNQHAETMVEKTQTQANKVYRAQYANAQAERNAIYADRQNERLVTAQTAQQMINASLEAGVRIWQERGVYYFITPQGYEPVGDRLTQTQANYMQQKQDAIVEAQYREIV